MLPVGYRPIRIASNKPTLSSLALVAWLVACVFLYCAMEYFYPSL